MSAAAGYLRGLYQRFAYYGAWLPNSAMKLGDVGVMQGGAFQRLTTLGGLGIPFDVRAGTSPVDFAYTSQSSVKVQLRAAAEVAAAPVAASVVLELGGQGAFLFHASGCVVSEVEGRYALGEALAGLLKQQRWKMEWCVVDSVVAADCATIVVSDSQSSSLELGAKAPVEAGNLARADAGLEVRAQQGDVIRFIGARGLTPLFKISRLKWSLWAAVTGSDPISFGAEAGEGPDTADDAPAGPEVALEPVPLEL
jgi:hypothetical protein